MSKPLCDTVIDILKIVLVMYMYFSNSVIKNTYNSDLHMRAGVVCSRPYLNYVEDCRHIGVVLNTAAVCAQKNSALMLSVGMLDQLMYIVQLPRL